ncbi:hypothetical protein [Lentzea tibetensis]|uniref:hypothetical protein n=1 Tax=Lentzea tibetensis TaxID=2591470 RepID=UPI0016475604|nr:hypothetical protein [Lentzea tibetensis]
MLRAVSQAERGFPFWEGSTWEWELGEPARTESGTGVLFRHYGFGDGYAGIDLGHGADVGIDPGPAGTPHSHR